MAYKAAVITVSDKGYTGEREDKSGPELRKILETEGCEVVYTCIVPDEKERISAELIKCADELGCALVCTTGGTGFSQRDITPEATLAVVERLVPGIPEVMRAESMKITPNGCLSREIAGIRGKTLIVNLPGSVKAVRENLSAVLKPLGHGIEMLMADGSTEHGHEHQNVTDKVTPPSMDEWLREAKNDPDAGKVGMYLVHNGVVRETAKAKVRQGAENTSPVKGMLFSYDPEKLNDAIASAKQLPGIYYVRVWLAEGKLNVGDDIMFVLIGGDIRTHVVDALQSLVSEIKNNCVTEKEEF